VGRRPRTFFWVTRTVLTAGGLLIVTFLDEVQDDSSPDEEDELDELELPSRKARSSFVTSAGWESAEGSRWGDPTGVT